MWKKWFNKQQAQAAGHDLYDKLDKDKIPAHVAVIMDGNGRWAQKKGMPRTYGHSMGVEALRKIVTVASDIGLKVLTTYAFSTENWKRPAEEVEFLMKLFSDFLDREINELHNKKVQIRFIGKLDDLAPALQHKMEKAQVRTRHNPGLILNLAVNYGGRAELVRSVQIIAEQVQAGNCSPADIDESLVNKYLYTADLPDPDLLIRPGGDCRISNFLLWQLAYTEIWLTGLNWPDFGPEQFIQALLDYQQRERRFGGLRKT